MANIGEHRKTEEQAEEPPKPSLTIVEIAIDALKPDPTNPRKISDQQIEVLTRAIRENGFIELIVVRAEDNMIVGGHQRVRAARRLGYAFYQKHKNDPQGVQRSQAGNYRLAQ